MANDSMTAILGELEALTSDPKATEDFTEATRQLMPQVQLLVEAGRLHEAAEEILALEKKCRQACDASSCSFLCCNLLSIFKDANDWDNVIDYIVMLCKKRGQLKRCIIDMVQRGMQWLDSMPSIERKTQLLHTLSGITEGKIFVEVERARLVLYLAQQKEEEGNIEEAANLLQDVQVETFGAMDRREKALYILEQMRLVILKNDFVRSQVISRKINPKLLEADDFQDIKLKYYQHLIEHHLHENEILCVCKAYYAIFNTKCTQNDEQKWQEALQNYILYLLLAPYDNEQKDMLERVKTFEKKKLSQMPIFEKLIDDFLTIELIPPEFSNKEELSKHSVFQDTPHAGGQKRWSLFIQRVTQHNIRVIAKYYSQIRINRMADHLHLTPKGVEAEVSELVSGGFLKAKMDIPAGIIKFGAPLESYDHLNEWAADIGKSIDMIEELSHLVQKERMVHSARLKKLNMMKAAGAK